MKSLVGRAWRLDIGAIWRLRMAMAVNTGRVLVIPGGRLSYEVGEMVAVPGHYDGTDLVLIMFQVGWLVRRQSLHDAVGWILS